jgi:phospholipid/cholesterol/gamma-HCH transport system substrate-binding protein
MRADETPRRIKVGLFLAGGLGLAIAMLIAIGSSQHPFARKVTLHTSFRDTAGLEVGAPVLLGGVEVGTVDDIHFAPTLEVKDVSVTLSIQARFLERIRTDSRAMLTPKGLLGDLTVTITVGSASGAALAEGATLASIDRRTLGETVSALEGGIDDVRALSRGVQGRLEDVVTPELGRDLGRLVRAAADSAEAIQHGDGLAHALIYDRTLAPIARSTLRNAERGAGELATAMARLDRLTAAVEAGGGTLHRLVYSDDAEPILTDARRAARELADAAVEIRRGQGPLHTLVYGKGGDDLLRNLTALSETLKRVGDDLAAGKGTLGALLEDPTIYEDLKLVLRDVKRNALLKALVRFTIERDHLREDGAPMAPMAR